MSHDFEWTLEVMDSCPLFAQDLGREINVQWVVERAQCDLGVVAVTYTRSPDLERPFTSDGVLASLWEQEDDDDDWQLLLQKEFLHIGLAKRWCMAQSEIFLVCDANDWLQVQQQGIDWGDEEEKDD